MAVYRKSLFSPTQSPFDGDIGALVRKRRRAGGLAGPQPRPCATQRDACAHSPIQDAGGQDEEQEDSQWEQIHGHSIELPSQTQAVPQAQPCTGSASEDESEEAENDRCGVCGEYGDLVLCDGGCDRAFHLLCVALTTVPSQDWCCAQCSGGEDMVGKGEAG